MKIIIVIGEIKVNKHLKITLANGERSGEDSSGPVQVAALRACSRSTFSGL